MIKMNKNLKKTIIFGLLIIYIITFFILEGLIYPFIRYVLTMEAVTIIIYMMVFIAATIFIIGSSLPIVNFLDVRKAWLIYMPFLLISLGLIFIMSSFILFLISAVTLGIGFGGSLYIIDFALVYNEDGNKTRMQSCVFALILSLLIAFLCFGLSWIGFGITLFSTEAEIISPYEVLRLRLLMMIFPATALLIGILVILIEKGQGN